MPPRELDDQLTAVLGDGDPEYEKCMEDGEDEERDEPADLFNLKKVSLTTINRHHLNSTASTSSRSPSSEAISTAIIY